MKNDFFKEHQIKHIDYKDVKILKRFINPHARIISRKRSNLLAKNQRALAQAIKRARYMGLLPYVSR